MTRQEDFLSVEASKAKLKAAEKGTLFQTLVAVFTAQFLEGGFDGKQSEEAFYEGLAASIFKDYQTLGCLDEYKSHKKIGPSTQDNSLEVLTAIENQCSLFWVSQMRYRTPQQMKEDYQEQILPAYQNLMKNGVESECPGLGLSRHNIQSVEVLVSIYHMSNKVADMLKSIDPSFSLPKWVESG